MIEFLLNSNKKTVCLFHPVFYGSRLWLLSIRCFKVVAGPKTGSCWLRLLHGAASKHQSHLQRLLSSDASNDIHHHLLWVPRSPPRRMWRVKLMK